MTLAELHEEVYEFIGEPSDLYDATAGTYDARLTGAINEGVRTVASWKDRFGRVLRYPDRFGEMFFQTYFESGTLDADGSTSTVVLPSGAETSDDFYNGWAIEVSDEVRRIVDYTGGSLTATVHEEFSSAPESGDSYELSKDFMEVVASGAANEDYNIVRPTGFLRPIKIVDLEDAVEVVLSNRVESFTGLITSRGDPSEYLYSGGKIRFDYVNDSAKWYRMEYVRMPELLSDDDDEPELPDWLQYGVVLWCRWWGYARAQSPQDAYAAKKDFEDFLRQRMDWTYFRDERTDVRGTAKVR